MKELLLTEYNYCKWLLNQPESENKQFEKARECLNFLLEDDDFVGELADALPNVSPTHGFTPKPKKPKLEVTFEKGGDAGFFESTGKDHDTGPTPKIPYPDILPKSLHVKVSDIDGIDFLLASRIDPLHEFEFEHAKDTTLLQNFMNKYETDGIDTLLILQRVGGELILLNYKFVTQISEDEGECDFVWQG